MILLASHNTVGARAAEEYFFSQYTASKLLHHLIIVPDLWEGMMGDDWLNNASTRSEYGRYIEVQLENEIKTHVDRMKSRSDAAGIQYRYHVLQGDPTRCLIEYGNKNKFDEIIIGSRRPKKMSGLNSSINISSLKKHLRPPLVVVPFSDA